MDPDGIEREAGYERALRAAGLRAEKGHYFTLTSAIQPGSASIQALLRARTSWSWAGARVSARYFGGGVRKTCVK